MLISITSRLLGVMSLVSMSFVLHYFLMQVWCSDVASAKCFIHWVQAALAIAPSDVRDEMTVRSADNPYPYFLGAL